MIKNNIQKFKYMCFLSPFLFIINELTKRKYAGVFRRSREIEMLGIIDLFNLRCIFSIRNKLYMDTIASIHDRMQELQSLLQIKPLDVLVRCRISEMYHYAVMPSV